MKLPKGFGYIVLSVLVGMVATLMIHRYVIMRTEPPTQVKRVSQVLVAATDIIPGTRLTDRLAREVSWPQDIIPARALHTFKQVKGRVVMVPISKGEPILLSKLAPEGTAAGLAGLLKKKELAMTVRTDDVSGVAGFIHPGDRVDVLVSLPIPGSKGEKFSKIILQNIKVLSTGQVWAQTPGGCEEGEGCEDRDVEKKLKVHATATLEVTPEQAEILNLGSTQGKIRLALRNSLNMAEVNTSGVATSNLVSGVVKSAPSSENPGSGGIEVIKGVNRSSASL